MSRLNNCDVDKGTCMIKGPPAFTQSPLLARYPQGRWFELAQDWAYMLPIVEMALNPVHLRHVCYLHEKVAPRTPEYRRRRERTVDLIVKRPSYSKRRFKVYNRTRVRNQKRASFYTV